MVVTPKLIDDGKEVSMRVRDGSIHCGGMVQRNKILSPRRMGGILLFLTSINDCARHWADRDDSHMPLNSRCSQMDEGMISLIGD